MPWSRKIPSPIILKDGRALVTLADARAAMLSLPPSRQQRDYWLFAGRLMHEAAASQKGAIFDTAVQLRRALKVEGLI